ncbi:helix-turn-helix domain-containing protein [Litchfieldia alkalitelluris]|uniref:helix-turn-helix domain-containing protein n=1 Tax=Litchfieldia alkalitelluris TaxID=304268 RepID=UPI000997C1E0|nr:helix-turn-helix domain-containing protein [Litchfieldia alkalitelluris]
MSNYIDKIASKCNLIAESFHLPVLFITPTGGVIYENIKDQMLNPLYENRKEKLFNPLHFKPDIEFHFPVIKKSAFSERYILISVRNGEVFEGTVVIGPSLSYPLSEDIINGIINDARAFFYRENVIQYYQSLPIIAPDRLVHMSVMIFHLFNNILLSPSEILSENSMQTTTSEKVEKVNLSVSQNLQEHAFHHDRLFEKRILYIIREGRVEDLSTLAITREEESTSLLSKSSYLRSLKNHIITLITLVSRASMDGGLHEEIAFSLHDSFIQHLEELQRLDDVRSLARDVLYTYAEKVKQVKDERYSITITKCKDYIFKHIYEEISHNDVARVADLSQKYLSVLFKKEVGISISEYIQQTKIEEAKKLIGYTKTPISEVCSLLNYNDQSYFTKVFKKVVGITPKQFRERHHLMNK